MSSGTPTVRTFLIADVRGYTRYTRERGDEAAAALAAAFAELVDEVVREHDGTLQEVTGDEALVVFDSARAALRCAVELQRRFLDGGFDLGVGMGLDSGEAVAVAGGFRGGALNLASRLCAQAGPGEILASPAVVHLAARLEGISYTTPRLLRLKGYAEPVRAVEVVAGERAPRRRLRAIRTRLPRARTGAIVVGALLAAGGIAAGVLALTGGEASALAAPSPSSVVEIDPKTNDQVGEVPVGNNPATVAVGEQAVWVLNADDQTISRIEPGSGLARPFGIGTTPLDVAAGAGAVWVGNGTIPPDAQVPLPVLTSISRIDATTLGVQGKTPLTSKGPGGFPDDSVAVTKAAVWVIEPDQSVSRIDPRTGDIAPTTPTSPIDNIAAGANGAVWGLTLRPSAAIVRIHPAPPKRIAIPVRDAVDIAVGGGSVWVSNAEDGTVWRIDPGPQVRQRTVSTTKGISTLAYGEGAVWVVNSLRGTVARIDPATNTVTRTIEIAGTPRDVAVGAGHVWVSNAGASCGKVVYAGKGNPDYLVVSDLPLRSGPGFPALAMSRAIERVFREHGFRGGRYTLGYQACDDSTSQSGLFDVPKCAANAKSYAAAASVIGVIGSYNSGCAFNQIPFLNEAPDGPLAMVSPSNSYLGLTRPDPYAPPEQLGQLYPTGKRNFARVYPADDAHGAAAAIFIKSLGTRKAYVLLEKGTESYAGVFVRSFRAAARRKGLAVAGPASWDPRANDYATLAGRVRRSGARAVFVAGLLGDNGGGLKGLRAALGPHVTIVASAGGASISDLFDRLGAATARSIYVTYTGLTDERLSSPGRRLVKKLAASQPGEAVHPLAAYAAQAAEVLLSAIGRSDGTRASVTKKLFATDVRGGIIGTFHFDVNGDAVPQQVSILRPRRGGGSRMIGSPEGATVVRVVDVPPSLLRQAG